MMNLFAVVRCAAVLSAVVFLGVAPASPIDFFVGSWTCNGTAWRFARVPDAPWIRVIYGKPSAPDGQAFFGYVGALTQYVYRDFHTDGSYADLTANVAGTTWTFTGRYYPPSGAPIDAHIAYVQHDNDHYDRIFGMFKDGAVVPAGRDACVRVAPSN